MKRLPERECPVCGGRTTARTGICRRTAECLRVRNGLPAEVGPTPCRHRSVKVMESYPKQYPKVFQILRCNNCGACGVLRFEHTVIDWRPGALRKKAVRDNAFTLKAQEPPSRGQEEDAENVYV